MIAGSDSSGGAYVFSSPPLSSIPDSLLPRLTHVSSGLEADQKTIAAHGCYAMTATTALTAQNTQGVRGVHVIPASFVQQQVEACIEDVGVDVVKTGEFGVSGGKQNCGIGFVIDKEF